jgi:hypothetical protein
VFHGVSWVTSLVNMLPGVPVMSILKARCLWKVPPLCMAQAMEINTYRLQGLIKLFKHDE